MKTENEPSERKQYVILISFQMHVSASVTFGFSRDGTERVSEIHLSGCSKRKDTKYGRSFNQTVL